MKGQQRLKHMSQDTYVRGKLGRKWMSGLRFLTQVHSHRELVHIKTMVPISISQLPNVVQDLRKPESRGSLV